MDASTVAVIFYVGILSMAATVAVLTVIYTTRPRSSKTASGPNSGSRADGEKTPIETTQRQSESNETVERDAGKLESPPDRGPVKAESANYVRLPAAQKSETAKSIRRRTPRANMRIKLHKGAKAGKATQVEPNEAITDGRATSPVALKEEHVSPPENEPSAKQPTSSKLPISEMPHNLPLDIPSPAPEANNTASAVKDETHKTEPGKKEPESHMAAKPTTELAKASSGQTVALPEAAKPAPQEPSKTDNKEPRERKAPADGLSELFTKDTAEEDQASRLAEGMDDIDVKKLLEEGLGLISKLKKTKG